MAGAQKQVDEGQSQLEQVVWLGAGAGVGKFKECLCVREERGDVNAQGQRFVWIVLTRTQTKQQACCASSITDTKEASRLPFCSKRGASLKDLRAMPYTDLWLPHTSLGPCT